MGKTFKEVVMALTTKDLEGMETCYRLGGIDDVDLKNGALGELIRLAKLGLDFENFALRTPLCKIPKEFYPVVSNMLPGSIELIQNKESPKPNLVIAHWCDLYKAKYGAMYDIDKTIAGIIAKKCKQWSFEKFSVLFQCYLAIDERFYNEQKHPLSLFFRDIQKINVAAQTRKNPATSKIDKLFENKP